MRVSLTLVTMILSAATLCGANLATAKTEVELNISGLEYTNTSTKSDLDDVTVRTEEKDIVTVEPTYDLNVYADKMWIDFSLTTGKDANGGTLNGGYAVTPEVYVGAILEFEQKEVETRTKVTGVGGAKSTSKTQDNLVGIGPLVHYRSKSASSIIEANGAIIHLDGKNKDDDGTTDTTTSYKMLALAIGGDYMLKLADRFFIGAGASYVMSLSGDTSRDSGSSSLDGDFDYSSLRLSLAQFMVEF